MEVEIRFPTTDKEWQEYYDLRYRILREPWNQPKGSERNDGDNTGMHFALFESKKIRAVARLDHSGVRESQVRFVAVEFNEQGRGYGRLIMEACENAARDRGDQKVILHAREGALEFYERIDYQIIEKTYLLFGQIQHFLMEKKLNNLPLI
ncbi:MAG: GNAT family N-acetyltransferase [Bacteroidota bacterium]